jgi:hypothetical protein
MYHLQGSAIVAPTTAADRFTAVGAALEQPPTRTQPTTTAAVHCRPCPDRGHVLSMYLPDLLLQRCRQAQSVSKCL